MFYILCPFYCVCSKTERPPSLSLYPGGDGMVRGGPGGARMVSSDIWHSSDLSRPVYAPGYQVWQIWLCPSGRSHANHHSVSHSPSCLLVSRSGSWEVDSVDTSRPLGGPWFLLIFVALLWRFFLILAIWNKQMCLIYRRSHEASVSSAHISKHLLFEGREKVWSLPAF